MNELIKSEIKQYSKEQSQGERDALAGEIREKRKEYFARKKNLSQEILELKETIASRASDVEGRRKKIEEIERAIAEKTSSAIAELLNFFEIRKLNQELAAAANVRKSLEDDYLKTKRLLGSLDESLSDKHELAQTRESLTNFYRGKEVEWNSYSEDLKIRDVADIVKKHQIIFVHAINPYFIPGSNSPLHEDVNWQTKLKIVLAFEPSIATSTVKAGDDWQKMWARMGLLLNGGRVDSASVIDQASVPSGLKKRLSRVSFDKDNIKNDIERAITHQDRGYNEFIVDNPQVAGFYVCLDGTKDSERNDFVPNNKIIEALAEYKMPIYAIKRGEVFEAEYDHKTNNFQIKEKITPDELLTKQFKLDDAGKTKIKEELFADSPFKISAAEMSMVDSRAQGRQTYLEVNFWHGKIKDMADNPALAEFPRVGAKIKYFIKKGRLILGEMNTRLEEKKWQEQEIRPRYNFDNGFIEIGCNTERLGGQLHGNADYLSGMESALKRWSDYLDHYESEKNKQALDYSRNILSRLLFHLYGYAEQAGELVDTETQVKARELAASYLSQEEYNKTIRRRIDNEGRYKITEAELKQFE